MSKMSIERRVDAIEERNRRVENDKRWETSLFRRVVITLLTYIIVYLYLIVIDNDHPMLTAVVPALGYFLSTLLITSLKKWWLQNGR